MSTLRRIGLPAGIVLAAGLLAWHPAQAGLFDSWGRCLSIEVTNYPYAGVLTNFPLLVRLGTNIPGFAYGQFASPPYSDLRFTDAAWTSELPYEVELWNTGGVSYVWVQIPMLTNNTRIFGWWGRAGQSLPAYATNGAAWESSFAGVWHLGNTSGTNVLDSTSNRCHGGTYNMPANPWTNAPIGNGLLFDGTDDYVTGMGTGIVPQGGSPYTVSVWFRRSIFTGLREMISQWFFGGNDFFLGFNGNNVRFSDNWASVDIALIGGDTNWHHLTAVSTPSNAYLYLDGELRATRGSALTYTGSAALWFGRQGTFSGGAEWFAGMLDEVRVEGTVRPGNWIMAAWLNQKTGSDFIRFGEVADRSRPVAQPLGPAGMRPGWATLQGQVLSDGGAEAPQVYLCWGPTDMGTGSTSAWPHVTHAGSHAEGSFFSAAIGGLLSEGEYVCRCYATNSAGSGWSVTALRFRALPDYHSWPYRMKLSFPVAAGEALTNFPVLVRFSENVANSGFSYSQFGSTNGADLRFANSDKTQCLPHEIERWDTGGVSTVWVLMPLLASTNDFIWALWGNPGAPAPTYMTGAVWSSAFQGVWHFGHTSGTNVLDSTTNSRHGVTYAMPANPWTNAAVGNGLIFDGANDYVAGMGTAVVPRGGYPYTVSVWFQRSNYSGLREMVSQWNVSGQSFFLGFDGNNVRFTDNWPSVSVGLGADANWYYLTGIATPFNAYLYLNGELKASKGSGFTYYDAAALWFGRQGTYGGGAEWFSGVLDDARIEWVARSSNWVWACWMNQKPGGTFVGYSPVQRLNMGLLIKSQ